MSKNKYAENEIRKKIPLTIPQKQIKYLKINITSLVKRFFNGKIIKCCEKRNLKH
jgi:hypothetical protein